MALIEEMEKQGNFLFRYRGVLPVFILAGGLILFAYSQWMQVSLGRPALPFDRFDQLLCLFLCMLGFAIRVHAVGHSAKNTSGRNTNGQVADQLNTSGLYSALRHPLYLGNFFMWLGMAVLTMNFWFVGFFIMAFWVYYERIMFAEEQYLRRKFGVDYLNWSKDTPAFIPRFKNWRKPELPFNWKKVIQKEKTGLLAIFTVVFLFDIIQDSIRKGLFNLKFDFWLTAFLFSLAVYLFLKISKNKLAIFRQNS